MNKLEKRIYKVLTDHDSEGAFYAYIVRVKDSPNEDKTFLNLNDALEYSRSLAGRGTLYAFVGSFTELK